MIVNSAGKVVMYETYMTPEEKRKRAENWKKAEIYNRFLNANPEISEEQELKLFRARQASKSLSDFLKVLDAFKEKLAR